MATIPVSAFQANHERVKEEFRKKRQISHQSWMALADYQDLWTELWEGSPPALRASVDDLFGKIGYLRLENEKLVRNIQGLRRELHLCYIELNTPPPDGRKIITPAQLQEKRLVRLSLERKLVKRKKHD